MKLPFCNNPALVLVLMPWILHMESMAAVVIFVEDFETAAADSSYSVTGAFSDGADDYFVHVGSATPPTGLPAYINPQGGRYWAVEDVDAPENTAGVAVIAFNEILIPQAVTVTFSLKAAAGSTTAFDSLDDFLMVEYRLNAGPWQAAVALQNDGSDFNSALSHDTDLDGIGDGRVIGLAFEEISSSPIALDAGRLEVRIDAYFNADTEAIAFDDFKITAIPEPAFIAGIIGSLFLLGQIGARGLRSLKPTPP
jgi:hypothetical protein